MLGHFYVHGSDDNDARSVPAPIAIPWLETSKLLGVKPVLSYTSEILWNWTSTTDGLPTTESIQICETFTGHPSEIAFDSSPIRVELVGAPILAVIHRTFSDHFCNHDVATLAKALAIELDIISKTLVNMKRHVSELFSTCDPCHFYNVQRPWISGSPPEGWTYDLGAERRLLLHLRGSTAAASPLLQALDAFLGLIYSGEHQTFREDLREYMFSGHRRFIQALSDVTITDVCHQNVLDQLTILPTSPPVQGFVHALNSASSSELHALGTTLSGAYDTVLNELKAFRDEHFKIVSLFVVLQAAKAKRNTNERAQGSGIAKEAEAVRGTGGSDLSVLLNGYRTVTEKALSRNQA
ncbi:Indoleamine 2,3-dioxygenase-like protein 4 [Elsinoe fawcettii]|nr:Indoleamine 2,3-dioxygenase-like protein 4 [Elsinoe fawcettii]